MSKVLGTCGAEGFQSTVWEESDERVWYVADFDNDADGLGGNPDHDRDFQPDTTLHVNGKPINPYEISGVVVPGWLPKGVKGVVHGCRARVTNLRNMRSYEAVVHDDGPTRKDGEGTPYLAKKLGINPNPVNGGEDSPVILYEIFPGVQALVDDVLYDLQPA